jgi:hypothetical protein
MGKGGMMPIHEGFVFGEAWDCEGTNGCNQDLL